MSSERAPFVRMANTWLRDGLQELTAAQHALANPSIWPRRLVAFHAQQATEKVLKAALVYARIEFGPTHSLNLLVQSLPDDGTWSTRAKYTDLGTLSTYATEARYLSTDMPVTAQAAESAVRLAARVIESVVTNMEAHGFVRH
jgi:HEPN domain-containing protein